MRNSLIGAAAQARNAAVLWIAASLPYPRPARRRFSPAPMASDKETGLACLCVYDGQMGERRQGDHKALTGPARAVGWSARECMGEPAGGLPKTAGGNTRDELARAVRQRRGSDRRMRARWPTACDRVRRPGRHG